MKRKLSLLAPLFPLGLLASVASAAPSTSALSIVGVENSTINPYVYSLNDASSDGSSVTASATQSFSGMDRTGTQSTMTFSGTTTTSAGFGRLHSYTSGSLTGSYFNAANPTYVQEDRTFNTAGSPDVLVSLGFAWFNDTLQFGGALGSGYKARYIFHVDGTNSGTGTLADLSVQIGSDPVEAFFAGDPGGFVADWATTEHEINGTTPQEINVQFSNQVVFNTFDLADGASVSGISDFSSTATLAAIQIVDANGNPVSGVTVTSGSGTVYPVPEPASFAALTCGVLAICRRRRQRKA